MLTAFDRHLAERDPTTLDIALERINGALEDGRVENALFDPLSDVAGADSHSLRSSSVRRPLRNELAELVRGIDED